MSAEGDSKVASATDSVESVESQEERLVEHISGTQLDMFQRCQYAYYRRYVLGEKKPPSASLVFGRADDETKNGIYAHKIESGETAPAGECQEIFAAEFDQAAQEVEDWGPDKPAVLKDKGVGMIGQWREVSAVSTTPEAVQVEFLVDVRDPSPNPAEPIKLKGYIDLIRSAGDGTKTIREHKTSGRAWSDRRVRQEELQAPLYSLGVSLDPNLQDVDPDYVEYEVAVKTKEPKLLTYPRTVDQEERDGMVKRLMSARRLIQVSRKTGDFLPNRKNVLCSKRWCGYWESCQREFGGEISD